MGKGSRRAAPRRAEANESAPAVDAAAVLERIRARGRQGVAVRELVDELIEAGGGTARSEIRRGLKAVLRGLEADGRVLTGRGKRLVATESAELLAGRLRMTASGDGVVMPAAHGVPPVTVAARSLRSALDGDKVLVRMQRPVRRARPAQLRTGEVVRVMERRHGTVVGRFLSATGRPRVVPLDRRLRLEIMPTSFETEEEIADGDLVLVTLDEVVARSSRARGTVLERLGRPDDPGAVERVIMRQFGLPDCFPATAEAEAAALPQGLTERDLAGRWDLRGRPAVTIDPETARDFDDAVSALPGRGGEIVVEVHIADVGHYVRPGTALDAEAQERGTSVYLPGRCVPMLPERVSSELCCLRPGEDRLAFTVRFTVAADGTVPHFETSPSVIHSRKRLVYGQVAPWLELERADWPADTAGVADSLLLLSEAADRLGRERHGRGSLDFDLADAEVLLDSSGRVMAVRPEARTRAHRLIEELMVAANRCVAQLLLRRGQPALLRVHDRPDPVRVEELRAVLARLGLALPRDPDELSPASLQKVLEAVAGRPGERLLQTLVLRSLARACYSPVPRGHYALALDEYLHFTSPIRRYPDLVCHRLLRRLLEEGRAVGEEEARALGNELERLGVSCSEAEQRADAAERAAVHWQTLLYLRNRLAEVFDGHITGVTPFGLFVQLDEVLVDGLVHVSDLGDDYYDHDQDQHQLVGRRSGRGLRLGDPLRVRLVRVDLETMQVQLELAELPGAPATPGPARGRGGGSPRRSGKRRRS